MSLDFEILSLRAQSLRDRADAAVDEREREACLDLARDYEAYLTSLSLQCGRDPAIARKSGAEPRPSAIAD